MSNYSYKDKLILIIATSVSLICIILTIYFAVNRIPIQKIKKGFSGCQMYGISNTGARIAAESFYPIRAIVDGYLDHFVIQKRWDSVKLKNCYATTENFGKNGSIDGKFETNVKKWF